MVNPQGTSFIPQRPTHGKPAPRRVRKIYILAYISYVLFFGSVISAAAVFFFNFSLDVQLDNQREVLAAERQQFNQGDIESVRDLEKRMEIARERLNSHVSVLSIFEALENSAVQSLSYDSFTYDRLNDQFPLITFSGTSDRFNNVLFQREVLTTNPILAGSSFKEIKMQTEFNEDNPNAERRRVSFILEKEVDTSLIGYTPRDESQVAEPLQDESDMQTATSSEEDTEILDATEAQGDASNETTQ